jgi:hypothetical protein
MKSGTDRVSVSAQIARIPAAVSPMIKAARQTVRVVAPEAEEVVCQSQKPRSASMMWKLIRYVVNGEVVVTIGTFTKHATIFFARGSEFDDGRGLLEGTGKSLRYVTLRTPADARRAALKDVVRKAFALAQNSARHDAS